jgi:hypothetical protein
MASRKRKSLFLVVLSTNAFATEPNPNDKQLFKVNYTGYIKAENFVDSRQVVAKHDLQRLLYPKQRVNDVLCKDINSKALLDMNAMETRMSWDIIGPDVGKAQGHGYIEIDFLGISSEVDILRMRHAYMGTWNLNGLIMNFSPAKHGVHSRHLIAIH